MKKMPGAVSRGAASSLHSGRLVHAANDFNKCSKNLLRLLRRVKHKVLFDRGLSF